MTRRLPWTRIVAEGVVIVASILLAFAIDRWWEGRRDAAAETALLADLRGELVRNVDDIDATWYRIHAEAATSTIELLWAIHGIEGEVPPVPAVGTLLPGQGADVPWTMAAVEPLLDAGPFVPVLEVDRGLIARMVSSPTYEPFLGSLDVLISGGGIADIRDPELRAALSGLPTELDDLGDEEMQVRGWARERVLPALQDATPSMAEALIVPPPFWDEDGLDAVPDEHRIMTLRPTTELVEVLSHRFFLQQNTLLQIGRVHSMFHSILARMDP